MLYCLKKKLEKGPFLDQNHGLTPWILTFFQMGKTMLLVQKWPFFHFFFFLGNIGNEKVFYDILERKNTFLGYKNQNFKPSKNWYFSKGVNPWLCSKNDHFSNFFFRQYKPKKCLLRYSRTRKSLSRL